MITRNETFVNGVCIEADIIDFDAGTFQHEVEGVIVEGPRPLTLDEIRQYGPKPLDATGSLATLLAVESVLSVQDAANAVGLTEQDLVNEAEAWSVGGEP
jgi:hypothetical protein